MHTAQKVKDVMNQVVSEVLKKINERNVIWFALVVILSTSVLFLLPSFFNKLVLGLESIKIDKPYSIIIVILLYLCISVVILNPLANFIQSYKRDKKKNKYKKIIDSLDGDELQALFQFALHQSCSVSFASEHRHLVRLLVERGIVSTGYSGPDRRNGSEMFFISEKVLNYITRKFQTEIQEHREKYS